MSRRLFGALGVATVVALVASVVVGAQLSGVAGTHDGFGGVQVVNGNPPCAAVGWASDPSQPAVDLVVRALVDGTEVATALADGFRQDLLDAGVGVDGTAAFTIDLTGLMSSGVEHEVRVQARDLTSGEWADLVATPRYLTCINLFGTHDGQSGVAVGSKACVAEGWAFDADTPERRVTVRVKVDGTVVADTEANLFRADVRDDGFGDGYSGWKVRLLGHIRPGRGAVVTAEAKDTRKKGAWHPLNLTPKTLTCLP